MKLNQNLIKGIEKQIHIIECKIQAIIEEITLKEQLKKIQTIPGVGKVLTWMIIAKLKVSLHLLTQGKWRVTLAWFHLIINQGHQSNINPKSLFADKELKSILHLAAMSAIRLIMNLEYIT
jgi:hypothetical protein